MRRMIGAAILAIISVVVICLGAWHLMSAQRYYTEAPEPVTIGLPPTADSSGLIYIAGDRGFFADNGLDVTIREYDVGLRAVDGLLKNENDIAVATEFVIVSKAFEREKITGIASLARYQDKFIIARKDQGIEDAADLEGKRIGCDIGTVSEFYLGRFIQLQGLDRENITVIDVKRPQFVSAIENGTVDAIIVWGPEVVAIRERLGQNAAILPAQSGQLGYWIAICRDDWALGHPDVVDRFLRSVDQAVDYTIYHPEESKAIMKNRLHSDDAYIAEIWPDTQFSLSLDESLITAMEDEARWMISNNLTGERSVPDFGDYINTRGLKEVKPEAVNIIT